MKVQEIMTTPVMSCGPDTNLAAAAKLMWNGDCGAIPVVGQNGNVVGILTDRDICIALATKNQPASHVPVQTVMTRSVFASLADDDVRVALATMKEHKVRRLPVLDLDGRLRGILSMNDIVLHAVGHPGAVSAEEVVGAFQGICKHGRVTPAVVATT